MTDVKYISGHPICDVTAREDIAVLQDDTDTTLSISGAAADAKAVGDALEEKADSDDVTITSAEAAALLSIARGEGDS